MKNLITTVRENKKAILKRGLIVAGIVVGIIITGKLLSGQDLDGEVEDLCVDYSVEDDVEETANEEV